ncbi:unnamed protein product [Polarella glacialis]|uniref:Uncharacterized protein n=1 Tax=Polarella glacialis TaxID=89957 RepID=A0A813ERV2_POLGL|nr:unnamed protein product [Polarella glacialis]
MESGVRRRLRSRPLAWRAALICSLAASAVAVCEFSKGIALVFGLRRIHPQDVPPLVDLMAAERRFMRYDEAAFASEAASAVEERKKLRQKFERLSEFDVLFELNDEAYEESDKGPESSILWQMQEQALLDCMVDGSIWRRGHLHADPSAVWKHRNTDPELTEEEEEQALKRYERVTARNRRSRQGKRRH